MDNWQLAAEVAQVLAVPATTAGVIISLWIGIGTLRELRNERMQRARPYLLFDGGGYRLPASLDDSGGIPGIDPGFAHKLTRSRPKGNNRLTIETLFDNLRNHGQGPAIGVSITYIPYRIFMGSECFVIDEAKRREPVYSRDYNSVGSMPDHISPGGTGRFGRIPTALVVDFDRRISQMDCIVEIACKDLFKNEFLAYQGLRIFVGTDPANAKPYVHMVFLDELDQNNPDWSCFGPPDSTHVKFVRPPIG